MEFCRSTRGNESDTNLMLDDMVRTDPYLTDIEFCKFHSRPGRKREIDVWI